MSKSMKPEDFMAMMDAIDKIANTYNLQIGFACDRGDYKPEDKSQIVINLEPKDIESSAQVIDEEET